MAEMQQVKPAQRATKAKEEEEASEGNKRMKRSAFSWLRERKVRELVRDKRRLVEVPYTATLAHTVNALVANRISAVPVAAPPGHWIGAGGSMILESDRATGAVRKHYIGMVTMLDVLAHIATAGDDENSQESDRRDDDTAAGQQSELDRRMAVPVSTVIGHSLEGLSLWTLNPNTSLLDCMETFSKGVHRALVPVESQMNHAIAVELVEASPGYRMLTQMDVLISFLREQSQQVKDILLHGVTELGAVSETIFAVSKNARVIDIIKSMRAAGLSAVPVVDRPLSDDQILQEGKGKRVMETFSATDLRECPIDLLRSWLGLTVTEFKGRLRTRARVDGRAEEETRKGVIACGPEARLVDVMEMAVSNHVHRVWVVEGGGMLKGLVSITDMLRVIRGSVSMAERELVSNSWKQLFSLRFGYWIQLMTRDSKKHSDIHRFSLRCVHGRLLRYVCEESNTNISGNYCSTLWLSAGSEVHPMNSVFVASYNKLSTEFKLSQCVSTGQTEESRRSPDSEERKDWLQRVFTL